MTALRTFNKRQRGFSLIDAMIAAVVLATGLLALAALQANITRNAADARARSQIVAFVEEIVERQRTYGVNAKFSDVPVSALWTAAEVTATQNAAGVSNLVLAMTSTHYDGRTGTFVTPVAAGLKTSDPQYKILRSVATWNDSSGQARRLDMTSVLSPRVTSSSRLPYDLGTGGVDPLTARPIVRTNSPVTDGMIPIAIGGSGDGTTDTAATNPKPDYSADNKRTSFEVLTYKNISGGDLVEQQRRVETAIVNCSCAKNAAPTDAQFQYAQWPAYWNGNRYAVYQPAEDVDPPGKAVLAGPATGVEQDELCTECCRDHHDGNDTTHVKFDPFRNEAHDHYKLVNGALEKAGDADNYLESCRMVRVDGFWRTAQDLDSKHFGLLATSENATNPVPDPSFTDDYAKFVIDFLSANYITGGSGDAADVIYDANGLNNPEKIEIYKPTTVLDERFLHTRGLYVDNIEPLTQAKIDKAYEDCDAGKPKYECVLPLLSFTSINVTESSFYASTPAKDVLTVSSDGYVEYDAAKTNRGRVNALLSAPAESDPLPYITARISASNTGLTITDQGIDPKDDVALTDEQAFVVKDSNGSDSKCLSLVNEPEACYFQVVLSGLAAYNFTPAVSWQITTLKANCIGSVPYTCYPTVGLPADDTYVKISAYNQQKDIKQAVTLDCGSGLTWDVNGNEKARYCINYQVSSASPSQGTHVVTNNGYVGNTSNGVGSESTLINTGTRNHRSSVSVIFTEEGRKLAPFTCTTALNNKGVVVTTGVQWKDCSTAEP